jgi:hypothetical protein
MVVVWWANRTHPNPVWLNFIRMRVKVRLGSDVMFHPNWGSTVMVPRVSMQLGWLSVTTFIPIYLKIAYMVKKLKLGDRQTDRNDLQNIMLLSARVLSLIEEQCNRIKTHCQCSNQEKNFTTNILSIDFCMLHVCHDRLCGLVVRAPGYRFRGPDSIPGTTRSSEK